MRCCSLWDITAFAVIKGCSCAECVRVLRGFSAALAAVMVRRLILMIDWEEKISGAEDMDSLKEVKIWLFQENIRLENAKKELDESREQFEKEQSRARRELEEMNRRAAMEQKRLKEENLFFEKKLAILQDGFRQLDEDRRTLERKRRALEERNSRYQEDYGTPLAEETVKVMFRGANNPLALRKRYRDLVKIFHPDNLFGDEELAQSINREYLRRKSREES